MLGNLDAKRDWGYAPEYCEGMWRMLQQDTADDYVLATGETHTIREFCELSFAELGIEIEWQGEGENEVGVVKKAAGEKLEKIIEVNLASSGQRPELVNQHLNADKLLNSVVVSVNPRYYRPTEVELLIGNPAKAKEKLDWKAETKVEELVKLMVVSDLKKANNF